MNCLKYVRPGYGFVPNFPLSGKLKVNGKDEDPIFTFLKSRCAAPMGLIANRTDITWTPIRNNDISWNFAKWLVGSDGHPYRRYTSRTKPQMIEQDILDLIDKCVKGDDTYSGPSNATVSAPLVQQPNKDAVGNAVPLNQPALVQTPDAAKTRRDSDHESLFF
jgi:glutathione peroxidase